MPIEYQIDHSRRVVFAKGVGAFTSEELFAYQREVWSRPEVAGYNELADISEVETVVHPVSDQIRKLADLSASMDVSSTSKFAIVAPYALAFGLGRMYEIYREMNERSTKEVRVFRTREEALEWLGLDPAEGALSPQQPLRDESNGTGRLSARAF
jgi:hypothetical protein